MTRTDVLLVQDIIRELLEKEVLTPEDKDRILKGVHEFTEILENVWSFGITVKKFVDGREEESLVGSTLVAIYEELMKCFKEK